MTFGRPSAIPNSHVQLDLPVISDIGEGPPFVGNETLRHAIQFFNCTMSVKCVPFPSIYIKH